MGMPCDQYIDQGLIYTSVYLGVESLNNWPMSNTMVLINTSFCGEVDELNIWLCQILKYYSRSIKVKDKVLNQEKIVIFILRTKDLTHLMWCIDP